MKKELKPSKEMNTYWISAYNEKKKHYEKDSPQSGKWLIFARVGKELDSIWKNIKILTEEGNLVDYCKVSTRKENPNAMNQNIGVICVYTYDSKDKLDLLRVADILFKIKDVEKLYYKEDASTHEGRYSNNGDKNISKYSVTKKNYLKILSPNLISYLKKDSNKI